MKLRPTLGFLAAGAAGVAATRVNWPSAARFHEAGRRFAADTVMGTHALRYEMAGWIEWLGHHAPDPLRSPHLTPRVEVLALGFGFALALACVGAVVDLRQRRRTAARQGSAQRPATAASAEGRTLRLDRAAALVRGGRAALEVARETRLSRDAAELLVFLSRAPDAIAGTGMTFRPAVQSPRPLRNRWIGRKPL